MKTYFSRRVYKTTLDAATVAKLDEFMRSYNSMLHFAYHNTVMSKRHPAVIQPDTLYKVITEKYPNSNVYLRNSALQDNKAVYKAQQELRNLNKQVLDAKIRKAAKKLDKVILQKQDLQYIKDALKMGHPPFKTRSSKYKLRPDGTVVVTIGRGKNRTVTIYNSLYDFECLYLKPKQKALKTRTGLLLFRLDKLQSKYNKLSDNAYIPSIVFGGKKLLKQTTSTALSPKQRKQKKQEFLHKRCCRFSVSGRCDSIDGNFVFRYNNKHQLWFTDHRKAYSVGEVVFPYGQDIIDKFYSVDTISRPISYAVEDHGDFYIFKISLDVVYENLNFSTVAGVIGVDCNLGFFSVADVTGDGNYSSSHNVPFRWEGSTEQISKSIELAAVDIVNEAVRKHKPIAMEDLKFSSRTKVKDYNSDGSKNFKNNIFANNKMTSALVARAHKCGVEVITISPIYTSYIAKKKYMPVYKKNIHELAAYTIGRRGMGLSEHISTRIGMSWSDAYAKDNRKRK